MDYCRTNVDKFAAKNLIKEQESNFLAFKKLVESKSYVPIPNVLLEHIVFNDKLSSMEKLLYLTTYFLGFINLKQTGHRNVVLSALKLSKIINCSKSQVLAMQKSLSDKGYLFITRQKNKFGQNNRNLLLPLLPYEAFSYLNKVEDRKGLYLPFNKNEETPLSYLERTKQYIPLNYQILKLVTSNSDLTARQKVLWLAAYARSYKNSLVLGESSDYLIFTSCYKELGIELNYSSKIIAADLNALVKEGFLQKQRFYVKNGLDIQDRCDKSLWRITMSLPNEYKAKVEAIEDRKGYAPRVTKPHNKLSKVVVNKTSTPISDPDYPQFRPHINKDFKTYKDRSRREADFQKFEKVEEKAQINVDAEIKEAIPQDSNGNKIEPFANQNNSHNSHTKSAKKSYSLQRKSLSEIEPITEQEATVLRNSSGREFTCSYMNKLVQRLAKLFPDHGFYNRKLFLSYMSKTLSQELRETTKANNTDFTFKADKKIRVQEKYLEEIETSYDTSLSSQLKKKIAGRFEGPLAYQILTSCDFQGAAVIDEEPEEKEILVVEETIETKNKQNQDENCEPRYDNTDLCVDYHAEAFKAKDDHEISEKFIDSFNQESQNQTFLISLSKPLNLRKHEKEMLLEQVRSVHGNKVERIKFKQSSYVNHVNKSNKVSGSRDGYFDKPKDEQTLTQEALLEAVPGSIWHKVSQNLIIKHGIHLYKAWFGKNKMEAIIYGQNKTLALKASTDFIASYVESNYFMDLRVLSSQESYSLGKILT